MQKAISKILPSVFLTFSCAAFAESSMQDNLKKADSLFLIKQYTQAYDLYDKLHAAGTYSPAMLLKMAFIQEGLDHLGESLFYLNLYYLASDDPQALKKMEELAAKNHLEGYESSEMRRFFAWVQEEYFAIGSVLVALNVLGFALVYYRRKQSNARPVYSALLLLILAGALYFHINYGREARRGIVAQPLTYLMSGPSAGSSVVEIIGEGHQLRIKGQEDVWLRVEWRDREVFVKEFLLRPVRL